jgi:hypothetical protein
MEITQTLFLMKISIPLNKLLLFEINLKIKISRVLSEISGNSFRIFRLNKKFGLNKILVYSL